MHSAIIVATMSSDQQRWNNFIAEIDRLRSPKPDPLRRSVGVEQLAENVWQVNFQQNPEPLARIVSCATQCRLAYKILQLDAEPQWLRVDPNPVASGDPTGYSLDPPDDD